MTIEELVRQLSLVYGAGLRCVALYGSAARGESVARQAGLNVLVLVDAIDMGSLRRESAVARAWLDAGHPAPMTLTMEEWRSSADIYPMEYADILAHHRVLHGALPVAELEVRPRDLRLQLEHEARSKVLRLRQAVLASGAEPRSLTALMAESVSTMLVLLRAALRVSGEEPPAESSAVMERVSHVTGVSTDAFRAALLHARGEARLKGEDAVRTAGEYLDAATALADWIDARTED